MEDENSILPPPKRTPWNKGKLIGAKQVEVEVSGQSGHCSARCSSAASCHNRTHAPQQTAPYSMTSSASASKLGAIVRPRAFAVLRLITSSYLVGVCTGRSAGFSPFRIRST